MVLWRHLRVHDHVAERMISVAFDGTDFFLLSNSLCVGWTQFSISLWYSPSVVNHDMGLFYEYSQSSATGVCIWRDEYASGDRYAMVFNDAAGHQFFQYTPDGSACGLNETDHVVITFDGDNEVRCFINGVEDANSPWACPTVGNIKYYGAGNFYLGGSLAGKLMEGTMWEVAIWEGVLADADVARLYAGGQAVYRMPLAMPAAPAAYWPMVGGQGTCTYLPDDSGNGHGGEEVGDPQWAA